MRPLRSRRASASWALAALAACALVRAAAGLVQARAPLSIDLFDWGQWLWALGKIRAGQVPFADFGGLVYGPLLYAWASAWSRVLGLDFHGVLLQLEVVSPLACLGLAYLVAEWGFEDEGLRALSVAAAFLCGFDRCFWSPSIRVWAALAAWAYLRRRGDSPARFALGAAAAGACLLVSVEVGASALAACSVLAAGRAALRRKPAFLGAALAAGAAPALYALFRFPAAWMYLRTCLAQAVYHNWDSGTPPPPLHSPWSAIYLLPVLLIAAVGAKAAWDAARGREAGLDRLSLAAFAAVLYRATALGRSDQAHLIFALAPAVLLILSAFEEPVLSPGMRRAGAALALAPFLVLSARSNYGTLNVMGRLLAGRPRDLVDWPAERIRAPRKLVEHVDAVAKALDESSPSGPLVSLPVPLYAQLSGRPQAVVTGVADFLHLGLPGGWGMALAGEPQLAVIDPTLALGLPAAGALLPSGPGAEGRLSFFTPADEAITRGLRDRLRREFETSRVVDGAYILKRRATERPDRKEDIVAVPAPAVLEPGRDVVLSVPSVRADEARIELVCEYPPGLASAAKPMLQVELSAGKETRSGELPVPPENEDFDLRVPATKGPVTSVRLMVLSPGVLNPVPTEVRLKSVQLVRYR